MNHLDRLERKIGYQFSDLKNLKLALTHRSAATQHNDNKDTDLLLFFYAAKLHKK